MKPAVTLTHVSVVNNTTGTGFTGGVPGEGGGIYNLYGRLALIESQVVSNMTGDAGTGYAGGGGLYSWAGVLIVTNSTIHRNRAGNGAAGQSGGDGGGLYFNGSTPAPIAAGVIDRGELERYW